MTIYKATIRIAKCQRCNHRWKPKEQIKPEITKCCPNCKSPYWNTIRKKLTSR